MTFCPSLAMIVLLFSPMRSLLFTYNFRSTPIISRNHKRYNIFLHISNFIVYTCRNDMKETMYQTLLFLTSSAVCFDFSDMSEYWGLIFFRLRNWFCWIRKWLCAMSFSLLWLWMSDEMRLSWKWLPSCLWLWKRLCR